MTENPEERILSAEGSPIMERELIELLRSFINVIPNECILQTEEFFRSQNCMPEVKSYYSRQETASGQWAGYNCFDYCDSSYACNQNDYELPEPEYENFYSPFSDGLDQYYEDQNYYVQTPAFYPQQTQDDPQIFGHDWVPERAHSDTWQQSVTDHYSPPSAHPCQHPPCSLQEPPSRGAAPQKPGRQKPGRKKGQTSKVYHLWEFIRDLLHDPHYKDNLITWEDQKRGIFRVIKSDQVAKLWGEKKKNKREMNYEKMSRSLRYSRKEGYFMNVPRDGNYPKKLCFRFGPKSHGWQ